jgi:hypothetical protein
VPARICAAMGVLHWIFAGAFLDVQTSSLDKFDEDHLSFKL